MYAFITEDVSCIPSENQTKPNQTKQGKTYAYFEQDVVFHSYTFVAVS